MKTKKIAALLAALLLAAVVPVSAFAAEGGEAPAGSGLETPAPAEGDPSGEQPGEGGVPEDAPGDDIPEDIPGGAPEAGGGTLAQLETEVHMVYIDGSEDMVRPSDPLTRAEAAKIIHALLKDPPASSGAADFSDIPQDAWYKDMVGSLTAAGLLNGYPNGTFGPDRPISRAEYVAVFTRCFEPKEGSLPFADVEGHWAYTQLSTAVAYGWLHGYEDNTVRPDAYITRAEAIAIANRALGRSGDKDALRAGGNPVRFIDLPVSHWAYADIMEASLPHEHEAAAEGEAWTGFSVPQAQRGAGYHSVGGELFCVGTDGHYVHNGKMGLLQFDANGRYTTGNTQLDARLAAVVRQTTVPGDTAYNNLRRLYRYVMNNFTYRANAFVADGATGWETQRAYAMLQNRKGNCYDYAALFTMLARKLGYQAQGRSGWIRTRSWSWDEHGWVQVELNGKVYLCDPEFEGVYVRNHGLNWDLFMKQYGTTPTRYRVAGKVLG